MTQLSIFMSHLDHVLDGRTARLLDVARAIEQAGAHQCVFSEHVALAQVIEGEGEASKFPFQCGEHYPDPFVAMAAIAGATTRLRVSTGILIAPLRPAIVLAKMIATLDQVSNGRLDIGFGSGWHEPEFRAAGVDVKAAIKVMEEQVQACRALWAGGPSTFHGDYVNFDQLFCVPEPLQGAGLPVWLAGPPTAKGADRVVRLGEGWLPFGNVDADGVAARPRFHPRGRGAPRQARGLDWNPRRPADEAGGVVAGNARHRFRGRAGTGRGGIDISAAAGLALCEAPRRDRARRRGRAAANGRAMSIEDEWAIRKLACQYAEAVDGGDGAALAALFTEDGALESPRGRLTGSAALAGVPAGVRERYRKTFHAVLNQVATVDGDRATAMTYGIARHLLDAPAGNSFCYEMTIRYADTLVRSPAGWRFQQRVLHVDWTHVYQINPGD